MHFQFYARVHDEGVLNSFIPQPTPKIQSQIASSQKTWNEPSLDEDQASIKIPKILVDSRLPGISNVVMQSSDAQSIYSKDISKEVQNVFNQNGQNQMIQELSSKLEQKQNQIDLLIQFLPKDVKKQLQDHAETVENVLKEEDLVHPEASELVEQKAIKDDDTNLNQNEEKSS